MVVESMTPHEVVNEYRRDFPEVYKKVLTFKKYNENKERRFMIKHKPQTPVTIFRFNYTSKSRNNFIIEGFSNSYSYWKKEGCIWNIFMDFYYHGGRNIIVCTHDDVDMIWLIPHFIQRYNERFLHSNVGDVAMTFLMRNKLFISMRDRQATYKDSFFIAVQDGVVLEERIMPNVACFKTFLSKDMLKGNQIDKNKQLGEILKDYYMEDSGLVLNRA